jgi:hypothetical protein
MQVYCRGSDRNTQKLAKDIAKFCAQKMMSARLARTLTVTIKFVKDLNAIEGDCEWSDDAEYRPKEFIIRVSDSETMELYRKLKVICHEMVHVKQYAKNEMRPMLRPYRMTKFMGALYPDDMDYWDSPWEIEAFGREVGLYTRWVDAAGHTGNPDLDRRV